MEKDNNASEQKTYRILNLYTRLINGEIVNKYTEAERFGRSARTIQHDIDDLRAHFAEMAALGEVDNEIIYDRRVKGYCLKIKGKYSFSDSEIFAVCKILLESRAFCKSDLENIIDKLIHRCVPKDDRFKVERLISNEMYHYAEPRHRKHFIDPMWNIAEAVRNQFYIELQYTKSDDTTVKRLVKPVGIMFSEMYFYLMAYIENTEKNTECENPNDISPTFYRIDRIQSFNVLKKHFDIPYKYRFEEGELRKRVLFMYGGPLQHIKFLYKGINPEPILDRLLTSRIIEQTAEGYIITAEGFKDGLDMWIRSQGDWVEILK